MYISEINKLTNYNSNMKVKNLFLTLLAAITALPLAAQLETGKVYRFINKADTGIALGAVSTSEVYGVSVEKSNNAQLWYAEQHPNNAAAWSLRSLGNGRYLRPTGTSVTWTFDSAPSNATVLYCVNVSGDYYTMNTNNNTGGSNCMHYATSQSGAVVGWNTGADATSWTIEEVDFDADDLAANWAELDAFNNLYSDAYVASCEEHLANLFEDKACTVLKKSFADVAALEADADYQALPVALQSMTKKVLTGDWSENNFDSNKEGWNSEYAKKFRVQAIEPYSIAGEITSWLGINAHINMDNPTGLFGNYRQVVYIMVEGEIKDGATLTATSITGHGMTGTYDTGVTLKEGLNAVPFMSDGHAIYLNYVVNTYNWTTQTFPHKLSDYSHLKVHIEGGSINGYYNGVGDHIWGEPDDDEDWVYYEERANLANVTILGKYQILHFCLNNTEYESDGNTYTEKGMSYYLPDNVQVPSGTPANQKINTMLEAWDRIHMSELATMGVLSKAEIDSLNALYPRYDKNWKKAGNIYDIDDELYEFQGGRDYSEYFNHHGLALGNFSGYMSGGWRNCNYHHNTMGSIIGEIATNAGSAWGPAHEIGHQHQGPMNLNGLTEVTNNLFSNVAVWYMGMGTSRVNGSEGSLAKVNENYVAGGDFFGNNIWALTHMYYRLWLYYHRCGHNTKFFPRLYELLRQEPMNKTYYAQGNTSILLFYKHACVAAGEDLTEFFKAHGFFKVMENRLVGDYANSEYTQSQSDINAAIAWVKAKGYTENIAPLFINDCVAERTYGHDGKTVRSYWDGETGNGKNATIGMYTACFDKSVPAQDYYYKTTGTTVTVVKGSSASGAIGFAVYSGEELVAFTNNYSVAIPNETSDIIVYAVQADGSKVQIPSAADSEDSEMQLSALTSALASAKSMINYKTTTGTQVGYYYPEALVTLEAIYNEAKAAKDNADESVHSYGEWAKMLTAEIENIKSNRYSKVNIKEKNIYTISNRSSSQSYLAWYNGALRGASNSQVSTSSDDRRWEFVSTGVEDEFYMKNVGQGKYITTIANNEAATMTTKSTSAAAIFVASYNGDGTFCFSLKGDESASLNLAGDKSIIGWNTTATASKWRVTLIENNAAALEAAALLELIADAKSKLAEITNVDENTETTVSLRENIHPVADNLTELVLALDAAIKSAEANYETALDHQMYIATIEKAIADLDGAYYVKYPIASGDNGITWYYIKNVEDGTYCGIDTESTSSTYKSTISLGEKDRESRNCWWAFEPTGNENEYKIYSAGYGVFAYTSKRSYLKLDGEQEAGVYTITLDAENGGLLIGEGTEYWNNSNANYSKVTSTKSHWVLEQICTEDKSLTGIEEIAGDADANGNAAIYDIYGRKVENITKSGIYIINGKKTLVK